MNCGENIIGAAKNPRMRQLNHDDVLCAASDHLQEATTGTMQGINNPTI